VILINLILVILFLAQNTDFILIKFMSAVNSVNICVLRVTLNSVAACSGDVFV